MRLDVGTLLNLVPTLILVWSTVTPAASFRHMRGVSHTHSHTHRAATPPHRQTHSHTIAHSVVPKVTFRSRPGATGTHTANRAVRHVGRRGTRVAQAVRRGQQADTHSDPHRVPATPSVTHVQAQTPTRGEESLGHTPEALKATFK